VEQELLTLPEHQSSPPVFSGVYKIPLYSTNHIAKYDNEIFDNHSEVKGNNENKVQEEFEDTKANYSTFCLQGKYESVTAIYEYK
jgi:hypothetical protein